MDRKNSIDCFKSYDVRGRVGESVTEDAFYRIGRAAVQVINAKRIVIGHDARSSSPSLSGAFEEGALAEGADIVDLNLAGTEEVYFGTSYFDADLGVAITASHNPMDYNGIKFVGKHSRPLEVKSEFLRIRDVAQAIGQKKPLYARGRYTARALEGKEKYVSKVLEFADLRDLPPLKVVINCGNGAAGPAVKELKALLREKYPTLELIDILYEPDGTFPNGVPNPMLPENHLVTEHAVLENAADFGVAFDGDFDRCFLFDHRGRFVPTEIIIGILCAHFAQNNENCTVVHDPRLIFNIQNISEKFGIRNVQSRPGHLFMKKMMRDHQAIYGGEISAHHYFKDFNYCDSGMIPWLLIAEFVGRSHNRLADYADERRKAFPSSGEINFEVDDARWILNEVVRAYGTNAREVIEDDGYSFGFDTWRFNIRGSNTEPLLRLNVESKGDSALLDRKISELSELIKKLNVSP